MDQLVWRPLLAWADRVKIEMSSILRAALELDFPSEEAERQMSTMINWGRYAELLAYDDDREVVYLEPGASPAHR